MKKITPTKINDHPLAIFQTMGGLQFNEITLKLDPDNYVIRVSGRSKKATIQFASLGIMKKNQLRFTAPGELFFKMANDLFYPDQSDSSALGRLSKVLREAFNIPSPPFIEGKPEFKFDVPKDRQEKLKAEKGMRSYDDLVLSSQEKSTNDYFKEFDPNYDPNDEMYNDNKD
jgi:hypothetical protein